MPSPSRTTRRLVRHLEVWSVFKVSLLFFFVIGIVWLVAGIVLWNVFSAFGALDNLEELAGELAGGDFSLESGNVLRAAIVLELVMIVGMTFTSTLLAVLYNLISDIVGGLTFIEEEKLSPREERLVAAQQRDASVSLPAGERTATKIPFTAKERERASRGVDSTADASSLGREIGNRVKNTVGTGQETRPVNPSKQKPTPVSSTPTTNGSETAGNSGKLPSSPSESEPLTVSRDLHEELPKKNGNSGRVSDLPSERTKKIPSASKIGPQKNPQAVSTQTNSSTRPLTPERRSSSLKPKPKPDVDRTEPDTVSTSPLPPQSNSSEAEKTGDDESSSASTVAPVPPQKRVIRRAT